MLQPAALSNEIFSTIASLNYKGLVRLWKQMEIAIFAKLDDHFQQRAHKFHDQFIQLFLVSAAQRQATEQVKFRVTVLVFILLQVVKEYIFKSITHKKVQLSFLWPFW